MEAEPTVLMSMADYLNRFADWFDYLNMLSTLEFSFVLEKWALPVQTDCVLRENA